MRKILFYDLETTPLRAWVWRCGKQVVLQHQLDEEFDYTKIICITYCWNDDKPAKVFHWGYEDQDISKGLEKFDELIKKADIVIGKNSDRFDNKHLNTNRLFSDGYAMPDWILYTDDLEKQLRKHFNMASYSLDYISRKLGLGGKIKMEFNDWINIVLKHPKEGRRSFAKMLKYGLKDIEDTRAVWNYVEKHIKPKYNASNLEVNRPMCTTCGSSNVVKNGFKKQGKLIYQRFLCNSHNGYAGRATFKQLENGGIEYARIGG